MQQVEFNLQIEMFLTNNDNWEKQDTFWCAYNEGYFRNTSTGNCNKWEDKWWRIGKVEKNRYNSYDLIQEHDNRIYNTDDEALKILETIPE